MEDMLDGLYEDPQGDRSEEDYPSCPFLLEKAPRVHDFLRFDKYKGKARTFGSFSFRGDKYGFILTITDKDREQYFPITCDSLQSGLEQLDQLIASKQIHWRGYGNPTENGKPKKVGMKK